MAEMDLARSPWSTARSTARSSVAGDELKQAYSPVTGLALTGRPAPRRAKSTPRRRGKGTRQGVPGFTGRKVFNAIQLTPKVGEIFSVAESDWLSGGGVAADADAEVAEPRDLQAQLLRQLSPRRPSRISGHPLSLDLRTQIAAEGVAIAQAAAAGGAANDVAAAPMPAVLIPRATVASTAQMRGALTRDSHRDRARILQRYRAQLRRRTDLGAPPGAQAARRRAIRDGVGRAVRSARGAYGGTGDQGEIEGRAARQRRRVSEEPELDQGAAQGAWWREDVGDHHAPPQLALH